MAESESDELEKLWLEQPQVMRRYVDLRQRYEQLVGEVSYILKRRIADEEIEVASISGRAKTLKSLAEKILRKEYQDPLNGITDLAGVRCVFLYLSDRKKIEQIIEREFEVVEKIDKIEEKAEDEFGYGALHYVAKLGKSSSGARYDDLKEFKCEIQVRTVLQDAWAIIDHHLVYKREKDAPKAFRRRLNSLSGLFETADAQFDQLRNEREKYVEELKAIPGKKGAGDEELNFDLLWSYLTRAFPSVPPANPPSNLGGALKNLNRFGYKTLADLEGLFSRTKTALESVRAKAPTKTSFAEVSRAIALENEQFRRTYSPPITRDALVTALPLVQKRR